jgi:hypothetical protein
MKITVTSKGKTYTAYQPYAGAPYVYTSDKAHKCELAEDFDLGEVPVHCTTPDVSLLREIEGPCSCYRCDAPIGRIKVELTGTLFGLEEDSRVINGPWKVF